MGRRSTAVAWSMLAIDVASVGVGYVLMVVNGIFQDAPANQLGLLLAFSAFMVVDFPSTRQHHRLDLLGHRPAGRHRPTGLAVRRVCLRHQGRGPPRGRSWAPGTRPCGSTRRSAWGSCSSPVVSHRPAAVGPLAPHPRARRGHHHRDRRPQRPQANPHAADRGLQHRQSHRRRRRSGPRQQPAGRYADRAVHHLHRAGGAVAGAAVPALPRGTVCTGMRSKWSLNTSVSSKGTPASRATTYRMALAAEATSAAARPTCQSGRWVQASLLGGRSRRGAVVSRPAAGLQGGLPPPIGIGRRMGRGHGARMRQQAATWSALRSSNPSASSSMSATRWSARR